MKMTHGGTTISQGHQNKGTAPKPNPIHGGSGAPHGVTQAAAAPAYGGTFGMGTLKKGTRMPVYGGTFGMGGKRK
jgi:hypothetical protein